MGGWGDGGMKEQTIKISFFILALPLIQKDQPSQGWSKYLINVMLSLFNWRKPELRFPKFTVGNSS